MVQSWYNLGIAYYNLGKFDKAEIAFKQNLSLKPGDVRAYNNIGGLYFFKKDYQTAIHYFKKFVEQNPEDKEAVNNLGNIYLDNLNDSERALLTLSLDVIYHLVEDEVFESYMRRLFDSSDRYVIIYSSNMCDQSRNQDPHVRHREFSKWLDEKIQGWKVIQHIPNRYPFSGDIRIGSFADFFIYEKEPAG